MKAVFALAAFALLATPALAADPMAGVYGNTVVSKGAKSTTKMWFKADHTYTGALPDGTKLSGTWEDANSQLCVMSKEPKPPAGMEKSCGPSMAGKKAGDKWQEKAPDDTYEVSITPGM
jgi:hypothetical protein